MINNKKKKQEITTLKIKLSFCPSVRFVVASRDDELFLYKARLLLLG